MNSEQLRARTKKFALDVLALTSLVKPTPQTIPIVNQIIRSATSVAANYRAACRSKTGKAFVHKISIVEEEADESLFWLEILAELDSHTRQQTLVLIKEADELTAIFIAIGSKYKANRE